LREQHLESVRDRIDLLCQGVDVLVFRRERIHARFRVADRGRERAQALIERLEFSLLQGQRTDLAPHRIEEAGCIARQLQRLSLRFLPRLRCRLELRAALLRELLDAGDGLLGFRGLLQPVVQLSKLHVHRPDHLVHAVRLDDRVLDRVLLALERLRFEGDVLGERVEPGKAFLGALTQLMELCERAELLLNLFNGVHRRGRLLARFARHLADPVVVLGERGGARTDLIELAFDRADVGERLGHLGLSLAQLAAKIVERAVLFPERIEARLRLQRL
jgi:hypothetical protein